MKKSRIVVLLLCICLIVSVPAAAKYESAVSSDIVLSDSVTMQNGILVQGSGLARENILQYEGEKAVYPIVYYGNTLYGRSSIKTMTDYLEQKGLSVVAAVNGAFFDMASGIPLGMVVTEGILRSSGNVNSVGFFDDGSAVIGLPELTVSAELPSGEAVSLHYNKVLTKSNGFCLYSQDYDPMTKTPIAAYHVLLKPAGHKTAQLTLDDTLELEVIGTSTQSSCEIPEGGFVLSYAAESVYTSGLAKIKALADGDRITVQTSCAREWKNVEYACSGGDLLIENNRICNSFSLQGADSPDARTAVGIKRDGTVVLYTVDQSNGSKGLALSQLAARMKELGCSEAMNLDGGNSTVIGATLPGNPSLNIVNSPSDGIDRPCANYIFLVREKKSVQSTDKLYLYPYNAVVLPHGSVQLSARAVDRNYRAASVPDGIVYNASRGEISDSGFFTAGDSAGTAKITASAGGASGSVQIRVITEPTSVLIKKQETGKTVSDLMVVGGTPIDLSASATYFGMAVSASDRSFAWSVSGGIGSIDENGVFTPVQVSQKLDGTITATCGDVSGSVNVTVTPSDPFADMSSHWAKQYVTTLYYSGVLTGSAGSDGKLYFRADDPMTRQEFIVALMRFLNVDADSYSSTTLAFEDTAKIGPWALNAMKAAYSLGYVGGSSVNGKLYANPTSPISRQESMVILGRVLELSKDGDAQQLAQFPDRGDVASWAEGYLNEMVRLGIITGSNGLLKPLGNVRRGEIAKMLFAIAERF